MKPLIIFRGDPPQRLLDNLGRALGEVGIFGVLIPSQLDVIPVNCQIVSSDLDPSEEQPDWLEIVKQLVSKLSPEEKQTIYQLLHTTYNCKIY